MSVIEFKRIVSPLKKATEYKEGELIKAEFAKKIYEAVICEISSKCLKFFSFHFAQLFFV